jgi:hypothetical protein
MQVEHLIPTPAVALPGDANGISHRDGTYQYFRTLRVRFRANLSSRVRDQHVFIETD